MRDRVHWKPTKYERVIDRKDIMERIDCKECGFIAVGRLRKGEECRACGSKQMGEYLGTATGLVTGDFKLMMSHLIKMGVKVI